MSRLIAHDYNTGASKVIAIEDKFLINGQVIRGANDRPIATFYEPRMRWLIEEDKSWWRDLVIEP